MSAWEDVHPTEKPMEYSIVATKPRLKLACLPRRNHLEPGFHQLRQVLRMHGSLFSETDLLECQDLYRVSKGIQQVRLLLGPALWVRCSQSASTFRMCRLVSFSAPVSAPIPFSFS